MNYKEIIPFLDFTIRDIARKIENAFQNLLCELDRTTLEAIGYVSFIFIYCTTSILG